MAYFPIFTQIKGKRCLIIGGGKVAARKIHTLLQYEADIVVIAREVCTEIKNCILEQFIFENTNPSMEKEIKKSFLVVVATNSRKKNHQIAEICHAYGILVNVADSEEESSFIFPSVVRKGNISIGINSGTGSPAVSKQIRKQIEKAVPDYYADIADFMGEFRQYVKENFAEEARRRYILKNVAAQAFLKQRILTKKEIEDIIRQGQK